MNSKIHLVHGDITKLQVDAIVNAANISLWGGRFGWCHTPCRGRAILDDCIKIISKQGGCRVGEALITTAGNMPAKYVIHTLGPVWNETRSGANELLINAYYNSLKLAVDYRTKTIAFPNISTGIYHFPKGKAARIAIGTVTDFLADGGQIDQVIFVCFDAEIMG